MALSTRILATVALVAVCLLLANSAHASSCRDPPVSTKTCYIDASAGTDNISTNDGSSSQPFASFKFAFTQNCITIHATAGTYTGSENSYLSNPDLGDIAIIGQDKDLVVVDLESNGYFMKAALTSNYSLYVSNVTFVHGYHHGGVGGVLNLEDAESVTIVDSVFRNSSSLNAFSEGGALKIEATVIELCSTRFEKNYIPSTPWAYGGAVWAAGSEIFVENCVFSENSILGTNGVGGALRIVDSNVVPTTFKVEVFDNVFEHNQVPVSGDSTGGGLAIFTNTNVGSRVDVSVEGNIFYNNSAYKGAGFHLELPSNASYLSVSDNSFTNNMATYRGGGIFTTIDLSGDNTFCDNSAANGTAIFRDGSSEPLTTNSFFGATETVWPSCPNCTFSSYACGDAVPSSCDDAYVPSPGAKTCYIDSTSGSDSNDGSSGSPFASFKHAVESARCGIVYAASGTYTGEANYGVKFTSLAIYGECHGCVTIDLAGDDQFLTQSGSFSDLYIANVSVVNASSFSTGGAIYAYDGRYARIEDSYFGENQVRALSSFGGAVALDGVTSASLCRTAFVNNKAIKSFYARGGAVYAATQAITVQDCNFTGNYVDEATTSEEGGALRIVYQTGGELDSFSVLVSGNHFEGNYLAGSAADQKGGALAISTPSSGIPGSVVVADNALIGNSAIDGGAIGFTDVASSTLTPELNGNNFTANMATNTGGAVYTVTTVSGIDNRFCSNTATQGAAIYAVASGDVGLDASNWFSCNRGDPVVSPSCSGCTFVEKAADCVSMCFIHITTSPTPSPASTDLLCSDNGSLKCVLRY